MEINVLMMGGKRAGKTTILSGMYNSMVDEFTDVGTNLLLDSDTAVIARSRFKEIEIEITKELQKQGLKFRPDMNPTSGATTYSFNVTYGGDTENAAAKLNFTDIPGEWINDYNAGNGIHAEEIEAHVEKSVIFMIAIDTPHLIHDYNNNYAIPENGENVGIGNMNSVFNRIDEITNLIQKAFTSEKTKDSFKLILFAPVKCERYLEEDFDIETGETTTQLQTVVLPAVELAYEKLISYIKDTPGLNDSCAMAITPILSLGCLKFNGFELKCSEEEAKDAIKKTTSIDHDSVYTRIGNKIYNPQWCEQPAVYTMNYVLSLLKDDAQTSVNQKAVTFGARVKEKYQAFREKIDRGYMSDKTKNINKLNYVNECCSDMVDKTKKDLKYGYKIIHDPDGIFGD